MNVVQEFEKNTANNFNSNISSIGMQKVHSVAHNKCESSSVTVTKQLCSLKTKSKSLQG